MTDSWFPTEDQERQMKAFKDATEGSSRVLAQRKRRTGLAVQFQPEHAERLAAGGLGLECSDVDWTLFGVPIAPGDYMVNVSGEGVRVVARREFEEEWEVVGDA